MIWPLSWATWRSVRSSLKSGWTPPGGGVEGTAGLRGMELADGGFQAWGPGLTFLGRGWRQAAVATRIRRWQWHQELWQRLGRGMVQTGGYWHSLADPPLLDRSRGPALATCGKVSRVWPSTLGDNRICLRLQHNITWTEEARRREGGHIWCLNLR